VTIQLQLIIIIIIIIIKCVLIFRTNFICNISNSKKSARYDQKCISV